MTDDWRLMTDSGGCAIHVVSYTTIAFAGFLAGRHFTFGVAGKPAGPISGEPAPCGHIVESELTVSRGKRPLGREKVFH
jgi:hypothetical protein